jgi:hypothetical protein
MALIGISRYETFDYVSDRDPCKRTVKVPIDPADASQGTRDDTVIEEGATVFELGVLDVFLMSMIYDRASKFTRIESDEVGYAAALNVSNVEAVRYGLQGWTHFTDEKGNDLPFKQVERIVQGRKYQACTDEVLQRLSIRLIAELAEKIKEASEVSKAEAKNSVTAS